jgi:Ubiquitin carboxyl-terminal hydrolase
VNLCEGYVLHSHFYISLIYGHNRLFQVIHIKRFRFNSTIREKLSTNVSFPVTDFDLMPYVSQSRIIEAGPLLTASKAPPVYRLTGVANHSGGLNGGHYIAHVDTQAGSRDARWMCFNDAYVAAATEGSFTGPSAYVLFYRLKDDIEYLQPRVAMPAPTSPPSIKSRSSPARNNNNNDEEDDTNKAGAASI